MKLNVAILGASDKPERFAFKAFNLLLQHGHNPIPINPNLKKIKDVAVAPTIEDIKIPIDTLTMYVGEKISSNLADSILKLHPRRIIFNPGSENAALARRLTAAGIEVVNHCTLIMLNSNEF